MNGTSLAVIVALFAVAAFIALRGKAPITSRTYTMAYNNATGAPGPEIQVYGHIMAQPEIIGGVRV